MAVRKTHLLESFRVVGGNRDRPFERNVGAFALANSYG